MPITRPSRRSISLVPILAPILAAMLAPAATAEEGPAAAPAPRIILADPAEWEGAAPADVRAVLESAGRELLAHVPDAAPEAIVVRPRGGPIVLFDRTPEGHLQVRLDTGGNLWAQYAFQFGHELCHILCRFDRDDTGNRWFEEALCETASLFVLRRMADTWERSPPYPNWRPYARALRDYAAKRLAASPRPETMPLADWYRRHRDELAERPTDRDNGLAIASALLPLFEERPDRWAAIHWLNADAPEEPRSFADHVAAWRRQAPERHAATIEAVAAAFGETLPADPPGESPAGP